MPATGAPPVAGMRARTLVHSLGLDIHGITVEVDATDARLTADLERRLKFFRSGGRSVAPPNLACAFELVSAASSLAKPEGDARVLCDPSLGEMLYFFSSDELYICLPGLRMLARPARGEVRVVVEDEPRAMWLATRSVFGFALTESLKRRGLYALHAASVEIAGKGLLLTGVNGAGKSTLTLALLRSGASGFQSDDLVFLRPDDRAVDVLPFPDLVAVTDETAARLPGLNVGALPAGARKHEVAPEDVPVPTRLSPGALVLLEPGDGDEYRLESVDPAIALATVAPNVLATETESSQRHLDVLAALVGSCPCYRLNGRGELAAAVEMLTALV
jgi:hypothetical protein